jgi:hypothetical protein
MKQLMQRWAGIGLIAAAVLTVGGMLTLHGGMLLTPPQQVFMVDGGGDRPAPPLCPKSKCWSGDATV